MLQMRFQYNTLRDKAGVSCVRQYIYASHATGQGVCMGEPQARGRRLT